MTGARTRERGFALLAVLLIVGLIAMFGGTYGRHVVLQNRSSAAALTSMRAGAALESGLQYTRQLLRTGGRAAQSSLTAGPRTTLDLSELDGDRSRVHLAAVDPSGIGATLLVEVERRPSALATSPDELPRLRADTIAALLADASVPKTWVAGRMTVEDADLEGLVVVGTGASLSLARVRLRGCIVSEQALTGLAFGPYDVTTAPTLLVAGDLTITPCFQLPGVALVMPDGAVSATVAAPRLQLDGDVVAHTLLLAGSGCLAGQAATVAPPSIAPGIVRPGAGRGPRAWSPGLELHAGAEIAALAVVPQVRTVADLGALVGYQIHAP